MTADVSNIENKRIARFLRKRLGEHTWRIDEAKAKLTKIMKEAKAGRPQLVGIQKPVVLVGLEELENLIVSLREPENWGEYFSTHYDDAEGNLDLTSPAKPGHAKYSLDIDQNEEAVEDPYEEIDQKLELAQAYMEVGDSEAASAVLDLTRNRKTRKVRFFNTGYGIAKKVVGAAEDSTSKTDFLERLNKYVEKNPTGSKVDCRFVRAEGRRVILTVDDDLPAIAFTRDAQEKRFKSGARISAVIVRSNPKGGEIAVSLNDPLRGKTIVGEGRVSLRSTKKGQSKTEKKAL